MSTCWPAGVLLLKIAVNKFPSNLIVLNSIRIGRPAANYYFQQKYTGRLARWRDLEVDHIGLLFQKAVILLRRIHTIDWLKSTKYNNFNSK